MSNNENNGDGTDTVKVPKTFLYMLMNLVIGIVLGGGATSGFTANTKAVEVQTSVEKTLEGLIGKIDKIDNSNKRLLVESEKRINMKLDSLTNKLDQKIDLNETALVNLDGYFKGYVESTKGN
ncbi:MAG: hypothetical protein GY938_12985 [Ketobacter sp.]|nr:hypothetical protein [Ketobacter sp.]